MPNLWTNTTRQIYETFSGPRTIDTEFNLKVEELKMTERNLANVQRLYKNFFKNTSGIKSFFEDVYATLGSIYDNGSLLWPIINEVAIVHQEAEVLYDILAENINKIVLVSNEWDKYFNEVRANLKVRDGARVIYDHYDRKLAGLVKRRQEKDRKGRGESARFVKHMERNDLKFKSAADAYVKNSLNTFYLMDDLIQYRTKFVNPTVIQLIAEELKYFTAMSGLFSKLQNITSAISNAEASFKKIEISYNPTQYIRTPNIVGSLDLHNIDPSNLKLMENKKSYLTEQIDSTGGLGFMNNYTSDMRPYEIKSGQSNITGLIQAQGVSENITITQPNFNPQNLNTFNNSNVLQSNIAGNNFNNAYPVTRTSGLNNVNNYNLQSNTLQNQNFNQLNYNNNNNNNLTGNLTSNLPINNTNNLASNYLQNYDNRVYDDTSNFSDDDLSVSGESDDEMAILAMNQVNLNQGVYNQNGVQGLLNQQNKILGGFQSYNTGNNDVHVQVQVNKHDSLNKLQNYNLKQ